MENNAITAPAISKKETVFDFWQASLLFLKGNLMMIPFLIVYFMILAVFKIDFRDAENPSKTIFIVISYCLSLGYVVWKGKKITNISTFSLKTFSFKTGILLFLLTFLSGYLLSELIAILHISNFSFSFDNLPLWAKILLAVVAAPILEEITFRGIILETFLKNYDVQKAILLSALLFGLIHFNPPQVISATILGVFIGWVYYRTKSLLPCIFMHFVNNFLSTLSDISPSLKNNILFKEGSIYSNMPNHILYFALIVASLLGVYACYKLLDNTLKS